MSASSSASPWPSVDRLAATTHDDFYTIHRARGLHLGPRFRSVQHAWGCEGTCYSVLDVRRPASVLALRCDQGPDGKPVMCSRSSRIYDLGLENELSDDLLEYETGHPALLDGVFQTTFLSSSPVPGEPPTALPVPFYIEDVQWVTTIDFDCYFGQVTPMDDERRHRFQVFNSNGGRVIGVSGFEAKTMRLGDSQPPSKTTKDVMIEEPALHPVIQRAAYFSELNSAERWPHLSSTPKREKVGLAVNKSKAQAKPSISKAKELLAILSLDAVLVEDMALMDAGVSKHSALEAPAASASSPPTVSSASSASAPSAWSSWAQSQHVQRDDAAAADDEMPEVIAVLSEPVQQRRAPRRAGSRHA